MKLENLIAECTAYDFKAMLASTDTLNVGDMSETKLTERQRKILD